MPSCASCARRTTSWHARPPPCAPRWTRAGTRWRGAGLDASTTNGPVALSIPRGYSCKLETGTLNGPFRADIPIAIEDRSVTVHHHRFTATLGSGGPLVRATTTNGPVVVTYAGTSGRKDKDEDD